MGNDLKPAHLLFQIVPKDDCTDSRVEFVSEEAVDLTIKQFEDELLQFLTSFDKLQKAGLGVLYERFAHQVLCRGTLLLTWLANVTVRDAACTTRCRSGGRQRLRSFQSCHRRAATIHAAQR